MRPELLSDPVQKQLDTPATRANIDVILFAAREQVGDFPKEEVRARPTATCVELGGAAIRKANAATRASHRVRHSAALHLARS
jgi:hypothetical protein